jgi:uncharacterized protein YbjQ (UPF0145 family)
MCSLKKCSVFFSFLLLASVLSGCFNSRSIEGLSVKSIKEGSGCESLGFVNGRSPPFALSNNDERIGAVNSAFNQAAKLGGNAIVVMNAERTNFGGGILQGEVFKCGNIADKELQPLGRGFDYDESST